jgi:hypothetical protein
MSAAIVPKSDQINADDLIAGPMTITITGVKIASTEQPVSVSFEGSNKFYRPCKSMCRVMVSAWGPDSSKYAGRSLTLYCDPSVKWGGMAVGGIRISHMSHIEGPMVMPLTVTKGSRKAYTVQPLVVATAKPVDEAHELYQRVVAASSKQWVNEQLAADGYGKGNPPTAEYLRGLLEVCNQADNG